MTVVPPEKQRDVASAIGDEDMETSHLALEEVPFEILHDTDHCEAEVPSSRLHGGGRESMERRLRCCQSNSHCVEEVVHHRHDNMEDKANAVAEGLQIRHPRAKSTAFQEIHFHNHRDMGVEDERVPALHLLHLHRGEVEYQRLVLAAPFLSRQH